MDWEILIPILMFAFPVVVALLDKRAKQKRTASQPKSRPVFPSVSGQQVSRELAPENVRRRRTPPTDEVSGPLPLTKPRVATVFQGNSRDTLQSEEGVRAIHRETVEKAPETTQPTDKLKIDKKKLIIYSEILKPKFDA